MSCDPVHHLGHRGDSGAGRNVGAVYQDYRYAQRSRSNQFGLCAAATGVLGHHMADAMGLYQSTIAVHREWAARQHHLGLGQGQVRHVINQAQQVMVLRTRRKRGQVLPANRQKHPGRRLGQCGNSCIHIGHMLPLVASLRYPGRALQGQQRNTHSATGRNRIAAHLRGERMGGIHHMADTLRLQPGLQTRDTAKAADPRGQWLGNRRFGAAGVRKHCVHTGHSQGAGQLAGFCGSTQYEDALHG